MNVFEILKQRGYIYQASNDVSVNKLLSKPTVIYQGFDPSANSFHAGHIMYLTAYRHLLDAGHKVIFLLGGGTGLVGDPTGKMKSRKLLSESEIKKNAKDLEKQARKLLGASPSVVFLNNADWLTKASLFDYLRNITPHLSVNRLLSHETYQKRLDKDLNLSLLEFLYSSLQAWDFLYLFENHDCRLQVGGQDQWRNILDGVELVRKIKRVEVFALTFPLLTTGEGSKMGKSERGTVWLDPQRTPPFDFYQYWLNQPDDSLERNLKLFTLLDLREIDTITELHPKKVQEKLAFEVTKFVHGEDEARRAAEFENVTVVEIPRSDLNQDLTFVEVLRKSGLVKSKAEARRLIEQGGVTFNESSGILKVGKKKAVRMVASDGGR